MKIGRSKDGKFLDPEGPEKSICDAQVSMPANVDYMATTDEGCTFVEGHSVLSPSTAKRFFDNGTFVYALSDEQGAYFDGGGNQPKYRAWRREIMRRQMRRLCLMHPAEQTNHHPTSANGSY